MTRKHFAHLFFFVFSTPFFLSAAEKSPSTELRILTFNMARYDNDDRLPSFVAALQSSRVHEKFPDIVLAQESMEIPNSSFVCTSGFLGGMLGMNSIYHKRTAESEGLGILAKWPLRKVASIILPGAASDPYERIALAAEVMHPHLGKMLVVNVHLASDRSNAELRIKQIDSLLSWIDTLPTADTLILGGDFNSHPRESEMAHFLSLWKKFSTRKSFTMKLFEEPTYAAIEKGAIFASATAERLDYIFLASAKNLRFIEEQRLFTEQVPSSARIALDKKIQKVWVSDHLPVEQSFQILK